MTWVAAAKMLAFRAANGLSVRFGFDDEVVLLQAIFLVFLLAIGFAVLQGLVTRHTPFRETIGLPSRLSAGREWATGAALGWAIIALSLLPLALSRHLIVSFWGAPRAFALLLVNLLSVAGLSLASELAFRGYAYRRLIEAIGPSWATIGMAVLYAAVSTLRATAGPSYFVVMLLLGFLLCAGWLRTHGLWLGWGLHFAWTASLGVLFGLPVDGVNGLSSVIETRTTGPSWLAGAGFGVEGAALTALFVLGAIAVLVRVTSDWAWEYTRPPLIPAGYPMEVAPPAAHTAMEEQAAAKSPALVQILPTTPQTRSVQTNRDEITPGSEL